MKTVSDLRNRLHLYRNNGPDRSMTEGIMVLVRQLIEHRQSAEKYPVVQLLCHLVLHVQLRDSALIYTWLGSVTTRVRIAYDDPIDSNDNGAAYTKAAATILDLDSFRTQLRMLLSNERLDTRVVDEPSYWYEFVCGTLAAACEKPCGVAADPKTRNKHALRYMQTYSRPVNRFLTACIREFEVFVKDNKFKVILRTFSGLDWVFTVASANPFSEYDAGGMPTTAWARTIDINASVEF